MLPHLLTGGSFKQVSIMQQDFLSFDPAVNQPALLMAWKKFVATNEIQTDVVPAEIAKSWIRSRQAGVDPFDFSASSYLNPEDYQRRVKKHHFLVEIARPIMESIYSSLEKTRYLVVLYDADGYHLLRVGKRKDIQRSEQFKIREGLCFEERHVGTCGFSLAKHLQRPVQIIGCEHYSSLLHYVTGSYAPILSPEKPMLIGVVGVTGARTPPNDHTQAIVIAAATAIENLLRLDKSRQEQFILTKSLQIAMNAIEDGVIIFNKDMHIIEMNSIAKNIFGLRDFYGMHITELEQIEDIYQAALQCLELRCQAPEEINCLIKDRMYVAGIKLLQKSGQAIQGIVVQLKNVQQIARIFQNIAGEKPRYSLNNIVASSQSMAEIRHVIQIASKTDAHVIIEGESGSGKEVVAQCIHNESSRKNNPFVVINCAAIPHELLESTLFGHEKGAFTGADTTHLGKFEIAQQGTLLLDEIGEMPQAMQAKMLRAIETRKIERVGGKKPLSVDVRIIAATNKDLYHLIRKNQFRADLFYRLNVFRICLPPLRERMDDIPDLVEKFLYEFAPMFKIAKPKVSEEYLLALKAFDWPGNVRELKNAVQYSLARLNEDDELTATHLNGFFPPPSDADGLDCVDLQGQKLNLVEKQVILKTLESFHGNKTTAAQALGISRATLYRKLR
jgi:sigma-54 dependent transcriptional regulator, acetoin dehydrogenase operon transcriptional activator AcoR